MTALAFLGTGLIATPMIRRLLAAGHPVRVWNRTRSRALPLLAEGAQWAEHPAEAVEGTSAVILCLTDAQAVQTVVFGPNGLIQASAPPPILVDHSSIDPQATRAFATRLKDATGGLWIDAPVSGGVAGAARGELAVMCGGDVDAIEQIRPVLAAYSAQVTRMGNSGAGQATKLCNQVIVAASIVAVNEAVRLARASGVDAARLPQALAGGWADSKPLQVFAPRMLADAVEPIGASDTMLKDLDTALAAARDAGVPMPVAGAVTELFRQLQACGLGAADPSRIVTLYERR
jgi:3-hydroxyisobutyrate dehydrogenase-like beta-hydroxyacid dehydrogenase